MRLNKILFALVAMLMVAATSCDVDYNHSSGGTAEILVVTQNDEQWEGIIGDTIRSFFQQYQYGLPQPEPIYNVCQTDVSHFSDMFKKHKCLLIVEINPSVDKPSVETKRDVYAAPQQVITIVAPTRASWCQTFNEQKESFKTLYDKLERERILSYFGTKNSKEISDRIKEKLGFDMIVPSEYHIAKDEPDFMWIRKELEKSSYGIFIYTSPDTLQLEGNSLISLRDRMMKKYVPGPTDGSFMTTEKEFTPPQINYISDYPAGYAVEMRGKWSVEGDFMGGPFISYTFHDKRTGNLVTLEGYIYYPNHNKRNDLLQLQSFLYSVKMPQQ